MVAANPPVLHLTEPVITPPVVAGPIKPPSSPTVTAAQEPPAVGATAAPPFLAENPSGIQPNAPIAADAAPPIVTGPAGTDTIGPANPPVAAADPASAHAPRPTFDRRILAVHNRERQNLGLEPLNWNPALAQSAQRWADHLAATGRFEHAPENRSSPEGENLWAGSRGYYAPEAMVDAWIREKRFFRPGLFPDNSTTGKVEDIGHYTQVVWRATKQVGCAQAASASEDILVCRYAEAGNYRGEQPF
jgi:uncharacterized protein YkwD